jgi:hypothetical protein
MFKLMTEAEVVDLVNCSRNWVKYLRLSRRLPFVPGRPPLILERHVLEAIEKGDLVRRSAEERGKPQRHEPTITPRFERERCGSPASALALSGRRRSRIRRVKGVVMPNRTSPPSSAPLGAPLLAQSPQPVLHRSSH